MTYHQAHRIPLLPQDRPTILFVSPVADLKGGAERVLLDLMDNPAIRPALAVPAEGELADVARQRGIELYFFDLGAVATVHRPVRAADLMRAADGGRRCAGQLARAALTSGAALLHTNGLKVHVIGALTRLLHGVNVVAHMHDIAHTRLERAIWRGVTAGVSRTIVVSRPCYPGAVLPTSVAVVMNGVRSPAAPVLPRPLSARPTVGFVGRFHPFKGLHLLLDWFDQARLARPHLRLLLRGRADSEGAAYWAALQPRIAALVATGSCQVLDWTEPGEDPYAGIDLLAVPSQTPDPAPLVILEAMSRGIPVIGYPAGGIPTLIDGPAHGALASDAAEFAAALDRLLQPEAYAATSLTAGERVPREFSMEAFWRGINAQYALAGAEMAAGQHG